MNEDLYTIVNHFGIQNQIKKLNEEVYELTEALHEYEYTDLLGKDYKDKLKEHIEEEYADVIVLLTQIKEYYKLDRDNLLDIKKDKIKRTIERIESGYYG